MVVFYFLSRETSVSGSHEQGKKGCSRSGVAGRSDRRVTDALFLQLYTVYVRLQCLVLCVIFRASAYPATDV